jgi:CRP-like cAMP-binding protein
MEGLSTDTELIHEFAKMKDALREFSRTGDKIMVTSTDLAQVPLFAEVEEAERQRLARKAADIRLAPGEFLIREGEEPRFFVIFAGELLVLKNIVGQFRDLGRSVAGEFSGETPIFMGVPQIVSLRAVTPVRAARFERQQLQELIRDSPSAAEVVFSTMSTRTHMAQDMARATPSSDLSTTPPVATSAPSSVRIESSTTGVPRSTNPKIQRLPLRSITARP